MKTKSEIAHRQSLFEKHVRKGSTRDCWEWLGATSRGAGTFGLGDLGVKSAHVAAWFLYRDSSYNVNLPNIFYHLCGNKGCVNPRHLAIIGSKGLVNPQEVLLFLADSYPTQRRHLMAAAESFAGATHKDDSSPPLDPALLGSSPELSRKFERLVAWYSDQCDGEWEDLRGIEIRTYPAIGWTVKIDLIGTDLEDKAFTPFNHGSEGSPTGWLSCEVFANTFKAWTDINSLPQALEIFLTWAKQ